MLDTGKSMDPSYLSCHIVTLPHCVNPYGSTACMPCTVHRGSGIRNFRGPANEVYKVYKLMKLIML